MIVETLGLQHLGQLPPPSLRLLELGSLVLEPDLDLILVKAELPREVTSPLLGQVSVGLELLPQFVELLRAEGSPGSLLVRVWSCWSQPCHGSGRLLLLHLPDPRARGGSVGVPGAEDPGWPQLAVGASHHPRGTVSISFGSLVGCLGEVNRDLHVNLGSRLWLALDWLGRGCWLSGWR